MLLCLPRKHWTAYIAAGFLLDLTDNKVFFPNVPVSDSLAIAGSNVIEVLMAVWPLYPRIAPQYDLTRPTQLVRLLGYGAIIAPLVASVLASCCLSGAFGKPGLHVFLEWFPSDALSISIVTPLYLTLKKRRSFARWKWSEVAFLFSLLFAVSLFVFWQTLLPILFLVFPFLLLIEVRLGLSGSSMGLLAVSVIGGYFTARGHGPIGLTHFLLSLRTFTLQFYVFVSMIVLYIVDLALAERNRYELSLRASEQRFRLLAENSHDMILLQDLGRKCLYVSPAVKTLLGWQPEEYVTAPRDEAIHPDDLPALLETYGKCRAGRAVNKLDYRCRKKDVSYLWVEGSLALNRDPDTGAPAGFINVIRDISSRKIAETQLSKALDEAESLSIIDPLTGIANRRGFDVYFENEWLRSARACAAMSLLMIDADHFKLFNDTYGHLRGDECLKQITSTIRSRLRRPSDLTARYGGEEFVVVLPNTDANGARTIAEQIRRSLEHLQIPHKSSPYHVVTVSLGCATRVPEPRMPCKQLLEDADEALYAAKAAGRNCIKANPEDALKPKYSLLPFKAQ
jgi:diguanylate cyclase (GGDEF)-like protein/PAS domain S-box-containing protein